MTSESITKDGITVTVTDEDRSRVRFIPTRPLSSGRRRPVTYLHIPGCGHFKGMEEWTPPVRDFTPEEFRFLTGEEWTKVQSRVESGKVKVCKDCVYSVGLRRESGLRLDGTPSEVDGKSNKDRLWGLWTDRQVTP